MVDYGLGAGYKIVGHGDFNGDGHQDLVAQNSATGALDFLFLDANANLIGSALSSTALPQIVGDGNFGSAAGQTGPTLVAQLANGELDMLGFNAAGGLIASDAISNTVGFAGSRSWRRGRRYSNVCRARQHERQCHAAACRWIARCHRFFGEFGQH